MLALWADRRGFASAANATLQERADLARAGGGDLSGVRDAYPPMPTFLAGILSGGTAGVAVLSSVCAGIAMQLVTARMVRRGLPLLLMAALVLALVAVPALWFEATQNLSGFLALMFLVVALDGFVRFVARGDTIGGFVAGLALAAAFLCDPIALVYTAALAVAAPLLTPRALRGEPGLTRATTSVLVFPILAVAGGWAFLEWRFTGGAFATLRTDHDWFTFPGGVGESLVDALDYVGGVLLRAPVYACVAVLLARRNVGASIAYLVPVIGLVLADWAGFHMTEALAFALLVLVALYSVPRSLGRRGAVALGGAAAVQFAAVLTWDPAGAEFHEWSALLF